MMKYADVIVDRSLGRLDRTFQYAVPEELSEKIKIGSCVRVPFGAGERRISGYVVDLSEEPKIDPERIKPVDGIIKDSISAEGTMISLAAWMREAYGCTMNAALRTVLPVRQKSTAKVQRTVRRIVSAEEIKNALAALQARARSSKSKKQLLTLFCDTEEIPWEVLTKQYGVDTGAIRDLADKRLLAVTEHRQWRNPVELLDVRWPKVSLNQQQQAAADRFAADWAAEKHGVYLLAGVTGSGKTEVYMEMMETVIRSGRQVILLIPEIALTAQTVTRFYSRFPDRISIVNSRMSEGERSDAFELARTGQIDVMIGPRSALFTPFPHLGLIILDEEHESSFKSEITPKYHARETAEALAKLVDASVVLGSATPSLESYFRAQEGVYTLLPLKERVQNRPLPVCRIVDLRRELTEGNRSILSRLLQQAIADRLARKEQVMLFINRRGLSGFVNCRACGHVIKCPRCDVSLTLHNDGLMHCHYCGHSEPAPTVCPHCGSPYIGTMRAGTQRFQEVVQKMFPEARVLRMDLDTTRGKHGHRDLLDAFARHEADILIGTQMIVKGHDFPNVTLVGVLAADLSLNSSDYRGAERTFQLLTQAAGRAGRGEQPGEVIIQTYQPDHYAVQTAAAQDYDAFFEHEIAYRRLLDYPPIWHMLSVQVVSASPEEAGRVIALAASALPEDGPDQVVLGPMDAAVARINDEYRKVLYVRSPSYSRLMESRRIIDEAMGDNGRGSAQVWYDFDPLQLF